MGRRDLQNNVQWQGLHEEVISKGRDKAVAAMHSRQDFKRNIFPCGARNPPNLPAASTRAYAMLLCFLQRFEEGMNINTARNFQLVEGNLHRRSCCQFMCYNKIKISISRDLENRL